MCFVTAVQLIAPTDDARAQLLNTTVGTERAIYDYTTEMDHEKRSEIFHIISRALLEHEDKTIPLTKTNSLSRAKKVVAVKKNALTRPEAEKLHTIIYNNENVHALRSPTLWEKLSLSKIMNVVGNFIPMTGTQAAIYSLTEGAIDGFTTEKDIQSDSPIGKAVMAEVCELYYTNDAFKSLIDHIKNDEREPLPIQDPIYTAGNWMFDLFADSFTKNEPRLKELQELVPSILRYSVDLAGNPAKANQAKTTIQDAVTERLNTLSTFINAEKGFRLQPETIDPNDPQKKQAERIRGLHSLYRSTSLALTISEQLCYLANFSAEGNVIRNLGNATAKGLYLVGLFYMAPSCPWTFCAELLGVANDIKGYLSTTDSFEKQCLQYLTEAVKKIHGEMNERFTKLEENDIVILSMLNQIDGNIAKLITDLSALQTNVVDAADQTFQGTKQTEFQNALITMQALLKTGTPTATDTSNYLAQLVKLASYANGDSWNPAFSGHEQMFVGTDFKQTRRVKLQEIAGILVPLVQQILPDFKVENSPNIFDWPLLPNFSIWSTGVLTLIAVLTATKQAEYLEVPAEKLIDGLIKQGEHIQRTIARLVSSETLTKVESVVV